MLMSNFNLCRQIINNIKHHISTARVPNYTVKYTVINTVTKTRHHQFSTAAQQQRHDTTSHVEHQVQHDKQLHTINTDTTQDTTNTQPHHVKLARRRSTEPGYAEYRSNYMREASRRFYYAHQKQRTAERMSHGNKCIDEQRFYCDICEHAFGFLSHLKLHHNSEIVQRRHHKIQKQGYKYQCPHTACTHINTSKQAIHKHMKAVHNTTAKQLEKPIIKLNYVNKPVIKQTDVT